MSREYLTQALEGLLATGQIEGGKDALVPIALEVLGLLAVDQGDMRRAAVLLGATEAQREARDAGLTDDEQCHLAQDVVPIRAALDESEFAVAWAEGRTMTLEQITAYAPESQ